MGETASGRKGEAERALRESEESMGPRGFWVLLQMELMGLIVPLLTQRSQGSHKSHS
jgi:hypothetical protein